MGDYIDRGPEIGRVLEIVRSIVDSGQGYAILGNHEVNALRFHQKGPNGQWLRPHSSSKVHQHQATLEQIAEPDPAGWKEWLRWFSTLPLWLEISGIRAVHAAWFDRDVVRLVGHGALAGEELLRLSQQGSEEAEAVERLLCGLELALPAGKSFETPDGAQRTRFRSRWWDDLENRPCAEAVFPPDSRMPGHECSPPDWHQAYSSAAKPVFFGHYAVQSCKPAPLESNVACLDYGMGKGGRLVAYRWDGEAVLDARKFVVAD